MQTTSSVVEWILTQRKYSPPLIIAIAFVCTGLSLCFYHLYCAYFGAVEAHIFRSTHLTFILVLAFLLYPLGRKGWRERPVWGLVLDLICVGLTILIEVYILKDYEAFCNRIGIGNEMDTIMGIVLVLLVLEAARRTVGLAMFLICVASILYALFSNHLFGILEGPPLSFHTLFRYMLTDEGGIYGIPLMAMANFILIFLIFSSLLLRTGAAQFFLDLAVALMGKRIGGPAKAAIISSMLMGTVSGSCVANVVATGAFTIPLMKSLGYSPRFAGAVEAVASSGGPFMPPIMGAAAFIIAAFLGISYMEVIIAAAIPAILYYLSLYFMVHFEARKIGLRALSSADLPPLLNTLRKGGYHLASLGILLTFIFLGYSASLAAFWGIVAVFFLSFLSWENKITPERLLIALGETAQMAIPVSIACAAAGCIIGSMTLSGLSLRLSGIIIYLSGGHLWLLLFLTMIMCLILGMGLPTTAIYIVVAALIVPVLVKMGVVEIGAHLFAFYFGVISAITPPVCMAAFAAAGIAGSAPMSTGMMATRIGVAGFIVPFVFAYNPALLFIGSLPQIAYGFFAGSMSIYCLASGLMGWHIRKATLFERGVLLAAVFFFVPNNYWSNFGGLVLLVGVLIKGGAIQVLRQRYSGALASQVEKTPDLR